MRQIIIAALVFACGHGVASAEDYRSDKAGYRVTIPEGWSKSVEAEGLAITSPRLAETLGMCLAGTEEMAETRSMSQTQIDEGLRGKFDRKIWEDGFKEAGLTGITIETFGEEMQAGHNTQYVVATFSESGLQLRFKSVMHFVPGRFHNINCAAFVAGYKREEADFETFFDSFTPFDTGLVAGLAPRGPFVRAVAPRPLDWRQMRGPMVRTETISKNFVRRTLSRGRRP